jgi:hypothetical protein
MLVKPDKNAKLKTQNSKLQLKSKNFWFFSFEILDLDLTFDI